MPRISAPTVAEHKEKVTAAITSAARELLKEKGYAAMTLGEVAARAGISRTSVYDYFVSKEDVFLAVLEEVIPEWEEEIRSALSGIESPRERISKYIETLIGMAADGICEITSVVRHARLSKFATDSAFELASSLHAPFEVALAELGQQSPDQVAIMASGAIDAAIWLINQGESRSKIASKVISLLLDGMDRT